jgi:hypothetical protein
MTTLAPSPHHRPLAPAQVRPEIRSHWPCLALGCLQPAFQDMSNYSLRVWQGHGFWWGLPTGLGVTGCVPGGLAELSCSLQKFEFPLRCPFLWDVGPEFISDHLNDIAKLGPIFGSLTE